METDLDRLKYPIGHFECPNSITAGHISEWISDLEKFPQKLRALVKELSDGQLDTPYRPGGWTVRQLVHHLADSHHHCYTRFKWALTEIRPIIKAYEEKDWADVLDARTAPVELSLTYLEGLHAKMVFLLNGLEESDFRKAYIHPNGNIAVSVAEHTGRYAWHGRHHYAHIKGLLERKGWERRNG